MFAAVGLGTATPTRVNVPAPFVSVTSPGTTVVLIRIGPPTPVAPVWICAMLTTEVAGKPCTVAEKLTVAAVIVPEASRVTLKSIVAVPLPAASGPVMAAGVSWAGDSVAVNRVVVVPAVEVEGVELLDEQ